MSLTSARSQVTTDDVWIILPAYDEGERLGRTLEAVCRHDTHVVVVDDGSTDDSAAIALVHGAWLLRHVINCGQGAALQTGLDFAVSQGAQILVTFDADGQHSADDIEKLIEPIRAGRVEVVLGSRFLGATEGMPWTRRLVLKLGVVLTRLFSRLGVTDTHNGLRAFSRRAAQHIRITQNRMAHASEILEQIRLRGLPFCEVPVTIRYTPSTLEKGQTSWDAVRILGQLLVGRLMR